MSDTEGLAFGGGDITQDSQVFYPPFASHLIWIEEKETYWSLQKLVTAAKTSAYNCRIAKDKQTEVAKLLSFQDVQDTAVIMNELRKDKETAEKRADRAEEKLEKLRSKLRETEGDAERKVAELKAELAAALEKISILEAHE